MTYQRCLTRLKRSFLPVICLIVLLLGYGPGELYLSNRGSEEFWFSFTEILLPMAILAAAAFVIMMGLLMVLPTKGYHIAMAVIVAVSVLLLLQGLFLPNNYGSLNGEEIDWGQYTGRLIYNTAIWLAVIAGAVFWAIRDWNGFRKAMQFAAAALLVVQAAVLITAGITGKTETKSSQAADEIYLTTEKLYTVSGGQNTIAFVLDAFDSQLMCDLLEENPEEIRTAFEDFTFYHNTSGGATRTKYAIPYILTGRTNKTGGSYSEYLKESFARSPLFQELRTGKYDTGFYTEYGYVDRAQTEAIGNLSSGGKMQVSSQWGLFGSVLKMSAFKYAPHAMKPVFWMYSFELAQWRGGNGETEPYRINDIQYYRTLQEKGLSPEADKPVFRFIHLKGAHGPFRMDENMQPVSNENGSARKQGLGSLRIVSEYIQQMKKLRIYENANIFILADHGDSGYTEPNHEQNPLLMVKEAGEKKEFSVSEERLSFTDLSGMMAEALQSRLRIDEKYEAQGTRYFYIGTESNNSYRIVEYASDGDAYDTSSWHLTGKEYTYTDTDKAYTLGEKLFFGENGGSSAKKYFVKGFSYPESDYAWSVGNEVGLRFETGKADKNLLLDFDYMEVIGGYQRVYLYAGGELFADFTAQNTGAQQFVIPQQAVKDGILDITILLPDAFSPRQAGTGPDGRILGIEFKSMTISTTDQPYEPGKQISIREAMPTQEILFGENGNTANYEISGISTDHWTSGKKATVCFNAVPAGIDLVFRMEYNTFGDSQHVTVSANGTEIADYTAAGSEAKEISIPRTLAEGGKLTIEISLPDASKPDNGDQRELALWMKKAVLREENTDKEE